MLGGSLTLPPGLTLPINFFNVVVFTHCQPVTALKPSAFEHFSTPGGGHTGAEAVDAGPAADFRLVSTLWHPVFLFYKIIAQGNGVGQPANIDALSANTVKSRVQKHPVPNKRSMIIH